MCKNNGENYNSWLHWLKKMFEIEFSFSLHVVILIFNNIKRR